VRYSNIYILLVLLTISFGQDFSIYENLLREGKIDEVQNSLPYLESQYPKHPFIMYLQATVENDGTIALNNFRDISEKHTNSLAGELSSIKVAEYLYSKGLYTQASEQLKIFPNQYPNSYYGESVFDLLEKSFLAIGDIDSIPHYENVFISTYPVNDFDNYDYYTFLTSPSVNEEIEDDNSISQTDIVVEVIEDELPKLGEKPWVVQVGAFGERKNADIIVNRLESTGYNVEVVERTDRVNLYLVQVVRFETIEKAINIGENINDQFGLEFRILERN